MNNRIVVLIVLLFSFNWAYGQWQKIEQDFRQMPVSVRPNPLWFWNNTTVNSKELVHQMSLYKKGGYGGLSILPFGKDFKPAYLTDDYFETYRVCVAEAEKLGLSLWIYDEYGFPSGTAGDINGDGIGRFKQRYPTHTMKRLDKAEYVFEANTLAQLTLPKEPLMAIVAMDSVTFERLDLQTYVSNNQLEWKVPQGSWKIMVFSCVNDGNTIVDYMSPEAVNQYIEMTHKQYSDWFGSYFGTTIKGTFFDEPTLYYAQGRPWTSDFNTKFELTYGFSPVLYYPALWYNMGEATEEARNYLFGFRTQLYAEGYTKLVSDWSKAHDLLATGHQDNEEMVNCVGTSGDLMKCFKYLDVPGIDKIGGNRPAEKFYKVVSSAAYNWNHPLVMSETYGAMGNISWNELFGIAMDQYVKGINMLIPHAVWYDADNVTFLPELSPRNPIYADSLNVFTDYLSRLNALMQNEAQWQGDIAVLYPIHTMQSGHYLDGPLGAYKGGVELPDLDYVELGMVLFDSLGYDFMFVHPEVLDQQCTLTGSHLLLNKNAFSVIVVPACKTISLSNLKKIQRFADAGGTVVFTTQLPEKGTRAKDNRQVDEIMSQLFTPKAQATEYGKVSPNGKVCFVRKPDVKSLQTVLSPSEDGSGIRFTGKERVKNTHKIVQDKHLWFLVNSDTNTKQVKIELNGVYKLRIWDPHLGELSNAPKVKYKNKKTEVELNIEGIHSLFLVEE